MADNPQNGSQHLFEVVLTPSQWVSTCVLRVSTYVKWSVLGMLRPQKTGVGTKKGSLHIELMENNPPNNIVFYM